jgi:ABC-2 type transport system permease protein
MLALLRKELADERQNVALFVPTLIVGAVSILLPVLVAIVIPSMTGERLSDSGDLEGAVELSRDRPETRDLDSEAAIQAYLFQFFTIMLVLVPVTSSMSLAAYSVVGEKQARTLEPLLVTPITTFELLGAKLLGAFIPSIVLTAAFFVAYILAAVIFARPGVAWVLLAPRSVGTVFVLGPLAALAALQMAICVSSRVNDARTAQQVGVLVILPIPGLLVGQLLGAVQVTVPLIAAIAAALLAVDAGLMWLAITLFDRETILTRWK